MSFWSRAGLVWRVRAQVVSNTRLQLLHLNNLFTDNLWKTLPNMAKVSWDVTVRGEVRYRPRLQL